VGWSKHSLNCTVNVRYKNCTKCKNPHVHSLSKLRYTAYYKCCCLLNVAIPATCVTSHYCSFLSSYTPSLCISLLITINNKLLRKLSMLLSLTLTDTQAVTALQLLQQPVFQQHRCLGFLYSTCRFE